MKKHCKTTIFMVAFFAIMGIQSAKADNTLSISDCSAKPGNQFILPVNLNNSDKICAFSFELVLPAGVSVAKNAKNKFLISLSDRADDHTVTSNFKDGKYYIACLSLTSTAFSGNSGTLCNITLELDGSVESVDEKILINNIRLATPSNKEYKPADVSCSVNVWSNNKLSINDCSVVEAGNQFVLPVNLNNSDKICAFSFELVLPAGVSIAKNVKNKFLISLSDRADDHTVTSNFKDGKYYIACLSLTSTAFSDTMGVLCEITLETDSSIKLGKKEISISNIRLATPKNKEYRPSDISSVLTVLPVLAKSISLNKTSLSIEIGSTSTLTATVSPYNTANKTVTWKSSNTAVATVSSSGVITTKSVGTATITATTTDGTNLSASCNLTVTPILATSVSLNRNSLSLIQGTSSTLSATVYPTNANNRTVTWKSSNTAVATVSSSGVVTAKSVGTATIIATTTDGTNLSASCSVTVTQILATSVKLNISSLSLKVGGTSTLTATVGPDNAYNKTVAWGSSNTYVATVSSSGIVTAKSVGTATIIATTTDGTNISASCNVNVTPILAGKISLNTTSLNLEVGGTSTLVATISPSNTTNKAVTWGSSNTSVCTVSTSGVVTAKSVGTATIIATTTDGTNLSASCSVKVGKTYIPGDANCDNIVDVADITAIASHILGNTPVRFSNEAADANMDGVIDVADITKTATIILTKAKETNAELEE